MGIGTKGVDGPVEHWPEDDYWKVTGNGGKCYGTYAGKDQAQEVADRWGEKWDDVSTESTSCLAPEINGHINEDGILVREGGAGMYGYEE